MKSFSTLLLAATGVMSAAVGKPIEKRTTGNDLNYNSRIMNSAAYGRFLDTEVVSAVSLHARHEGPEPEPDANRTVVTPENIFVLQCTEPGFRGDCLVFGATPGDCVSYFDYQSGNSTQISSRFNDNVTSLSTNTGGKCQFYKFRGCNDKGDDRGLTSSYNYNLGVSLPDDPRTVEYENEITSWRC
ncbi:hypothetical protein CDEST_08320 [Colletotrichum destructivum]|uniref:Uncharacterized protein n=1 Tax=Colletotrichum destructivum TaxID=34406 RepID=A0AAX4IK54_9PEZI|nr:hypothetical protein CDEST_08320 [Colletotrichum destructivum]